MHGMRRRHPAPTAARGAMPPMDNIPASSLNGHRGRGSIDPMSIPNSGRGGSPSLRRPQQTMDAIDASSCRHIFGWACIDNVSIPYILRGKTKYVSVRMVEMKLLSKYPSTYPDELKDRPPLTSQFITVNEAKLLNEINSQHCAFEYGQQGFDGQDLIVILEDFEEFYGIVKRNFPQEPTSDSGGGGGGGGGVATSEKPPKTSGSSSVSTEGGWVQVNNTIVPFLIRKGIKLVPLPVIRYGANLLNNVQVAGLDCNDKELYFLNHNCQEIGLDFTFSKATTKLIEISLIPTLSETKISITELPKDDPFGHALYKSEEEIGQPTPTYPSAMQGFPRAPPTSFAAKASPPGQMPPAMAPAAPAPAPERFPLPLPAPAGPAATISRPPEARNMQWMGPQMGMFPGGTQRGPPPPYNRGQPRTPSHTFTGPSVIARMPLPSGPSRSPHQQPLPSNHPALSPNLPKTPPTNSSDVLDLSAKASPPSTVVVTPKEDISRQVWQGKRVEPKQPMQPKQPSHVPHSGRHAVERPSTKQERTKDVSRHKGVQQHTSSGSFPTKASIIKLKDGRSIELQSTSFHGKGITCIVKDGDGFALLESLNRMFFPKCPLENFTRGLREMLNLEIKELTEEEEQAFIAHYELKIRNLRCTKVVSLSAMDLHMTQMKCLFSGDNLELPPAPPKVQPPENESQDSNNNTGATTTTSAAAAIQSNHRAACQALKNFIGKRAATTDTEPAAPPPKRIATSATSPRPAKHGTGRLENIMNKLKKAQLKPEETGATGSGDDNKPTDALSSDNSSAGREDEQKPKSEEDLSKEVCSPGEEEVATKDDDVDPENKEMDHAPSNDAVAEDRSDCEMAADQAATEDSLEEVVYEGVDESVQETLMNEEEEEEEEQPASPQKPVEMDVDQDINVSKNIDEGAEKNVESQEASPDDAEKENMINGSTDRGDENNIESQEVTCDDAEKVSVNICDEGNISSEANTECSQSNPTTSASDLTTTEDQQQDSSHNAEDHVVSPSLGDKVQHRDENGEKGAPPEVSSDKEPQTCVEQPTAKSNEADCALVDEDKCDNDNCTEDQPGVKDHTEEQAGPGDTNEEQAGVMDLTEEQADLTHNPERQEDLINHTEEQARAIDTNEEQASIMDHTNEQAGLIDNTEEEEDLKNQTEDKAGLIDQDHTHSPKEDTSDDALAEGPLIDDRCVIAKDEATCREDNEENGPSVSESHKEAASEEAEVAEESKSHDVEKAESPPAVAVSDHKEEEVKESMDEMLDTIEHMDHPKDEVNNDNP